MEGSGGGFQQNESAWNRAGQAPWALAFASTVPVAGRMAINRLRLPPDCDLELRRALDTAADSDAVALMRAAAAGEL